MATLRVLKTITSKYDSSVNHIIPYAKSFIETRYVRRADHYMSLYVSSQNGCKMGCKFCWLTDQKQNEFKHVDLDAYLFQLDYTLQNNLETKNKEYDVVNNNKILKSDVRVNINFMARGEALANSTLINNYSGLHNGFNEIVVNKFGYRCVKVNLSTIMPNTVKNKDLINIFGSVPVNIYYSLYSVNDKFKKFWMPNSIDWRLALDKLAKFQQDPNYNSSNSLVFHGTFIKGENDSDESVENLINEIKSRKFVNTKFNLVRFNVPPSLKGKYFEPSDEKLHEIFKKISLEMNDNKLQKPSTQIARVGQDAYVSCGMFPNDDDL